MRSNIRLQSARGNDLIPTSDLLFNEHRIIPARGEVCEESAQEIVTQLLTLDLLDPGKPIHMIVSGPGGGIDWGLMVIDTMKAISSPVYTICTGIAASMDAVIFAAGEKGHRYILPHSRIMIHEPLLQGGAGGSATSILRISESIQHTKRTINDLLAGYTGRTPDEIDKATSFDNYMSAEEAVEFGLCDRILDSFDEIFGKEVL